MTVGVVDESQLFRECVAAALEEEAAYCVTFQASSLEALQQEPPAVSPDVLLAACGSLKGNTAELIRWAAREMPGTKVLVLGSEEEQESEILDCIEAGASGLISRGQSLEDLKKSLAALASGETLCSPRLAQSVFSRLKELAGRRPQEAEEEAVLTARELEILELVADGLSNKEIAKKLIISLHTVKNHVHNILEKLEVSGRYAAVTYAYDRRWLRRRWQ
ncbi:MAG: response regulator transcription factor [Acidobacteria bacterium]|nr:response regulator transcription factor [Acidobacteriota bacterium]